MCFRLLNVSVVLNAIFLQVSCVTSSSTKLNSSGVEITYPDPEGDKDVPEFCNPTGKKGDVLKECFERNESLYKTFEDDAKQREPWFNFAPDNWVDSVELDTRLVYGVINNEDAVKRLETKTIIELSDLEVEAISGVKAVVEGYKPYLVRALYYFKETGTYSIFEKSDAILVRHDSIGATTPIEIRSAVIVFLKTVPKTVYIDCQVTE